MTEALAKGPEEAIAQSEAHINDFLFRGGADTEAEDVETGEKFRVGELIKAAWANAKEIEEAWVDHAAKSPPRAEEPKSSSFLPGTQTKFENPNVENPIEGVKPNRSPNPNLERAKPVA